MAYNKHAFGMQMPGRVWTSDSAGYRYGFNGKEKDSEVKGNGNHISFGDYGYDPRLGRRWRPDPLTAKYVSLSSYASFANNPIIFIDVDGKDIVIALGGLAKDKTDISHVAQNIVNTIVREATDAGMSDVTGKAFAADKWDNVKKDVISYIKANHTTGEKIIMYGYSWGGETVVELSKDLKKLGYNVDLLITIDAAKGPVSDFATERIIPDNVVENINFYQTTKSNIGSRGDENKAKDETKTNIQNIKVNEYFGENIDHGNIDEATESHSLNHIRSAVGLPQQKINPQDELDKLPKTGTQTSSSD
jgi:RHS repeat-associated protein